MTRFVGEYSAAWPALSYAAREAADWRCVHCRHPFSIGGSPLTCDASCDPARGIHRKPKELNLAGADVRLIGLNYGVHHLDGDKENERWWNLLALCNSCHLTIQATLIPEQGYAWEHSTWFKPYAAGFYAFRFGALETMRAEVEADLDRFLAMGQPHLYEIRP